MISNILAHIQYKINRYFVIDKTLVTVAGGPVDPINPVQDLQYHI